MRRSKNRRRGLSLLELLVVVTLIGIFSSVVAVRFGPTIMGNIGANTEARRISLLLLRAQRRAITTGDNHYVEFTLSGGNATHYRLMRRESSGNTVVEDELAVTRETIVAPSHSEMEFNFEGQALSAYSIDLSGSERNWQVTVVPVNGSIRTVEL